MPVNAFNPITLVLGAGKSRRFGSYKQLALVTSKKEGLNQAQVPMLAKVITTAETVGAPVIVALNPAVLEELNPKYLTDVEHFVPENWQDGLGASLAAGVGYIETHYNSATHIVVVLGDQIALTPEDLLELRNTSNQYQDKIIYSETAYGVSVPAVFPKHFWPELTELSSDSGAKKVITQALNCALAVKNSNAAIDIDTPNDLHAWQTQSTLTRENERDNGNH